MKRVFIVHAARIDRWRWWRSRWRCGNRWDSGYRLRRVRRVWCVGWVRRRRGCCRNRCRCGQRHDSRVGWSGTLVCDVGQGKASQAPESQQHREAEYYQDDPSIPRHVGLLCPALSRTGGYGSSVGGRTRGIQASGLYHKGEDGATRVLAKSKRSRCWDVACISSLRKGVGSPSGASSGS